MPLIGLSDARAQMIEAALGSEDPQLKLFTRAFVSDSLAAELTQLSGEQIVAIAADMWDHVRAPRTAGPSLSLDTIGADQSVSGRRRMRLRIVNDDMPFLVDSIVAEISRRGLAMDCLLHPIVDIRRGADGAMVEMLGSRGTYAPLPGASRESLIYIELERLRETELADLREALLDILGDVRRCVADWEPMLARLRAVAADLKRQPPAIPVQDVDEAVAFLDWMAANNFTLLGHRRYNFPGDVITTEPETADGLGLLADPHFPVWRGNDGKMAVMTPALRQFLGTPEPLFITKANAISTVHRQVHLDYVGVKAFDAGGRMIGEDRFIGLFTSTAYAASARAVPLLRRKLSDVIERFGFDPRSHAGRALVHVLEDFPRDEMFQIEVNDLTQTAAGLLALRDRPRPKLFVRRDRFERYVSVLVYIPREVYRADLRVRIGQMLADRFQGRIAFNGVQLGEDSLARVHFILATTPGAVDAAPVDQLDAALLELVRGWDDALEVALENRVGPTVAARLALSHGKAFSESYRAQFSAQEAAEDILRLTSLASPAERAVRLYSQASDSDRQLRVKIYRLGQIIPLSEAVPLLEHFGLRVIEEFPFDLQGGELGWIHDFLTEDASGQPLDLAAIGERLQAAIDSVFEGAQEDDGFNALVLRAGIDSERVGWLRAYSRYLRQAGLPYEAETVQAALRGYPEIARGLTEFFDARFNPAAYDPAREAAAVAAVEHQLGAVSALDDDRILRFYLAAIRATVRTNAFQPDRPAFAIKLRSTAVPGLPPPVPFMEIFLYGPRVEGIHLRGGKVARGGLRWSDRRDDYRTEVLGLLKAQMVKNAVIVPVGAKGGFYPRQLPPASDREAWLKEGQEAYKIYIRALLSLTDNRQGDAIVPPADMIRHDEDDPYLVVAADKGTATFSDTANAISLDHGFWLGDAFASGGSQGYDHKKMAITARGAWVSVERHFRELGVNVNEDPVRTIGVGDMSGDVFGNGMLLSRSLKLVAAFDHRHIFLDPDPDAGLAYAERQRLFALPRSSWGDYNATLLSAGGGIFPRSQKSIPLSPEVRALLGVKDETLDPAGLIRAILLAQVDLLWLGGIGTYVKAARESHLQVSDKANDSVRIDAEQLRVKVVGEGANVGLTQAARIAFARSGGRINTDFIDNSAGVDCSDNEVNIKILLAPVVQDGRLGGPERDTLLEQMTDDVAAIVLRDNYLQTQAISVAESAGRNALSAQQRLIQGLERAGKLNRAVEGLPTDGELAARQVAGESLTRPELAVLLSYAKITLYEALVESAVPDDPALVEDLEMAFPPMLAERYPDDMRKHRLRRELIATKLANAIVNRGGITLAFDLAEETGFDLATVAGAFVTTRQALDMRQLWRLIDSYDYRIPAGVQTVLHLEAAAVLRVHMEDMLRYSGSFGSAEATRNPLSLKPALTMLRREVGNLLYPAPRAEAEVHRQRLAALGAPEDVRELLIQLSSLDGALGLALLADELNADVVDTTRAYGELGERLGLGWAHGAAKALAPSDVWERLLASGTVSDFERMRFEIIRRAVHDHGQAPLASVSTWMAAQRAMVDRMGEAVANVQASEPTTVAKLTHLANQFRQWLG